MLDKKIGPLPLKLRGKKVLAIFAHPDDESISTGGLLLYCKKEKIKTSVCILSKGEKGKSLLKISRQKLAALRLKELKAACRQLGVKKLVSLDFPDMNFVDYKEEIMKRLKGIVAEESPDVVITHSPFSFGGHPDHIITSFCVFQVLKDLKSKKRLHLYFFILPLELSSSLVSPKNKQIFFVDISPFFQDKMDVCLVYHSQIGRDQKRDLFWTNFFFDKELFYRADFSQKYLDEMFQEKINDIRRLFLEIAGLVIQVDGLDRKSEAILKRKYRNFLFSGRRIKKLGAKEDKRVLRLWTTYNNAKSQIKKLDKRWYQIDLLKEFCFPSFNSAFKKIFGNFLALNGGLMLHASSLADNQRRGFVFAGKEDSGKSTILKVLPEFLALADDASILRPRGNRWLVHGSPFYERNKTAHMKMEVPVRGIFFLHKAKVNRIRKVDVYRAFEQLFPNIWLFRTTPSDQVINVLTFWWKSSYNLFKNTNLFNLYFNKADPILGLIERAIR